MEPTPDEKAGIDWWNALTEPQRAWWLARASEAMEGAVPSVADAWRQYKLHGYGEG
jgi:hypothetical protein